MILNRLKDKQFFSEYQIFEKIELKKLDPIPQKMLMQGSQISVRLTLQVKEHSGLCD